VLQRSILRGREGGGGGGGGGGTSKHSEASQFPPSLPTAVAEEAEGAYEPARLPTSPAARDRARWLWVEPCTEVVHTLI